MSEDAPTWRMHAHDRDGTYYHLGSFAYVKAHGLAYPIVEVKVVEVEENDPAGTHWGWLNVGKEKPTMIWPSRGLFDMCFTYGPEAEVKAGKGRILRLAATVV